jgi:peptidoglycan/LPS O-acetylase OafA/YrhL
MGYWRYILAITVVFYHLGGTGSLPGRIAVIGFYIISGFVIFRVLDKYYYDKKLNFALNRIIRLYPLFLFICAVSFLSYKGLNFVMAPGFDEGLYRYAGQDLNFRHFILFPEFRFKDAFPGLNIEVLNIELVNPLIPQSWSIFVEEFFYLLALIVIFIQKRSIKIFTLSALTIASFLFCSYVLINMDFYKDIDNLYKNAATTFMFFGLGGLCYFFKPEAKKSSVFTFNKYLILTWLLIVMGIFNGRYINHYLSSEGMAWKVIIILLTILTTSCIVIFLWFDTEKESIRSKKFGELSYSIYLNHFFVAWLMLGFAQLINFPIFGRVNETNFGILAMFFSTLFALFTHRFVEKPFVKLRDKIRQAKIE